MTPTEKRISELADLLVMHIIAHRNDKALKIAQHIRSLTGFKLYPINRNGYRVKSWDMLEGK